MELMDLGFLWVPSWSYFRLFNINVAWPEEDLIVENPTNAPCMDLSFKLCYCEPRPTT